MVKKALLIGINYKGTPFELFGCINDVNDMAKQLVSYGFTSPTILTDDTAIKPTRKNIEDAINALLTGTKSGDILVFHFSGHGALVKDNNGDEVSGFDGSLIPLDYATAGIILDDQMRTMLCDKVPAGVNLFGVMDCCHSGTSFDLRYLYNDMSRPLVPVKLNSPYLTNQWALRQMLAEYKKYTATKGNVVMLSACTDNQQAADAYINGKNSGALTACLVDTLKQTARPKWKNLLKDVHCRLILRGFPQVPQLSCGQNVYTENLLFL
jgi:hypothetical protein